jgi:hypothetical protein
MLIGAAIHARRTIVPALRLGNPLVAVRPRMRLDMRRLAPPLTTAAVLTATAVLITTMRWFRECDADGKDQRERESNIHAHLQEAAPVYQ